MLHFFNRTCTLNTIVVRVRYLHGTIIARLFFICVLLFSSDSVRARSSYYSLDSRQHRSIARLEAELSLCTEACVEMLKHRGALEKRVIASQ